MRLALGNRGRNLLHMSKANQKFVQADEAVSPVIGVILMVAITVVLAAVVFVLVSNLSKSGSKAPDVAFSTDETRDRVAIVTAATELIWADFQVKYTTAGTGDLTYAFNQESDNLGSTASSLSEDYAVVGTGSFDAGDFLDLCMQGGNNVSPTTIQFRHIDSNTVVYETTLNSIDEC